MRTDHKRLRELLSQVIQTPEQQYYLRKLLGFQFTIEYKKGLHNIAVDLLSRMVPEVDAALQLMTASSLVFSVMDDIRKEYQQDPELLTLIQQWHEGNCLLQATLIQKFHETRIGGHAGV